MKILITGGSGYIAKSIYEMLKHKYDISLVTRKDFDVTKSVEVNKFFEDKYFDCVIHCAVSGGSRLKKDDWTVLDNNLSMYYNLLSVRANYGRLIHFASGAELAMRDQPYGFSKYIIAKSILKQDNFYNLRIFGVFDENELDTRFIKANIKRYINKQSIEIHQDKAMDFIYMPDLVKLVDHYITGQNLKKDVDCIYGMMTTLSEIAKTINELSDYTVDVIINDEEIASGYVGFTAAPNIEFVGLKQGIINTYNKLK